MPHLGILGCKIEKVLSYFKSASSKCQNKKFRAKLKIFGLKEKLLSYLKSGTSTLS